MGSESCIYEQSNGFVIGYITHLGNFGGHQGRLGGGELDIHIHGNRDGFEVLKTISLED